MALYPLAVIPQLRWKPLHQILDIAELAHSTTSANGDRLDLRIKIALALTVRATFHGDATGDLVIHIFTSPDDDDYAGAYDTVDYSLFVLAVDAGEMAQKTIAVNAAPRFLQVNAENEDDAESITDIEVWAAPLGCEEVPGEQMVDFDWS